MDAELTADKLPPEFQWWYCLTHNRAELGAEESNDHRLGPYATEEQAAEGLQKAHERTEQWDREDAVWESGPSAKPWPGTDGTT